MIVTVSISELRGNVSHYLEKVSKGNRVFIRDEKRNTTIAQISQIPIFDRISYEKILRKAAGVFTKELHPEWDSKKDITIWLTRERLSDDRAV